MHSSSDPLPSFTSDPTRSRADSSQQSHSQSDSLELTEPTQWLAFCALQMAEEPELLTRCAVSPVSLFCFDFLCRLRYSQSIPSAAGTVEAHFGNLLPGAPLRLIAIRARSVPAFWAVHLRTFPMDEASLRNQNSIAELRDPQLHEGMKITTR